MRKRWCAPQPIPTLTQASDPSLCPTRTNPGLRRCAICMPHTPLAPRPVTLLTGPSREGGCRGSDAEASYPQPG